MIMLETDLFGAPIISASLVPARPLVRKIGYAARPGSGPRGQRCNTCRHAQRITHRQARSWKCEVMAGIWHLGPSSDIKPGAPACSEFIRKEYQQTNSRPP